MTDMSEQEIVANAERVLTYIRFNMKLLSGKVVVASALLLGFVVTVWAMVAPDPYRVGLAVAWWLLAYLPALWSERN